MGCANCGGRNSGSRCCLCSQGANKTFPWGKRKICWRCRDKQIAQIRNYTLAIDRAKTLLDGREWHRKEAEKRYDDEN